MKTVLKWFFGITFLLGGIGGLFQTPLFGIISIILGLFILPPTFKLIEQKTKVSFSSGIKWGVVVCGMLIMGFAISGESAAKDEEADSVVSSASELIDKGNIDSANVLLKEAKEKYSTPTSNKAVVLEQEIEKSKSQEFAKETLAKMSDEEFAELEKGSLAKSYLTQKTLNASFLTLLKSHAPERKKIIAEVKEKEEQKRLAAEIAEETRKQQELEKNRQELVEKQFSSWDGSHRGLTKIIKDNMNDPDTYDHMETRFRDLGDYLLVTTKFRGANAFGGKVINTVTAKVDFEGNVVEVISQD